MTTKKTTTTVEKVESDPKQMTEEVQSDRATTVQEQGIGPRDPYPTGNPPDPTAPSSGPNQYGEQKIKDDDGKNVGTKEV